MHEGPHQGFTGLVRTTSWSGRAFGPEPRVFGLEDAVCCSTHQERDIKQSHDSLEEG